MKALASLIVGLTGAALAACTPREAPVPGKAVVRYPLAEFYRNTEYSGASFSADGTRILVSSNRYGIWNAYTLPLAGGEPDPLTRSTTDALFAASYFPDDDRFLYASDEGGNELSREAMINKLYWATWHRSLGKLAMDVLGAEAEIAEDLPYELTGLQRMFLFTRSDTIYAGTNQIQRNIIAERALGMPREPKVVR